MQASDRAQAGTSLVWCNTQTFDPRAIKAILGSEQILKEGTNRWVRLQTSPEPCALSLSESLLLLPPHLCPPPPWQDGQELPAGDFRKDSNPQEGAHSFPTAALTNGRKLGGLEATELRASLFLEARSSKIKVSVGACPVRRLRGRPFLPLPISSGGFQRPRPGATSLPLCLPPHLTSPEDTRDRPTVQRGSGQTP